MTEILRITCCQLLIESELEKNDSMAVEATAKSGQEQVNQEPLVPIVNLADTKVCCCACALRACVLDACAWCTCASRTYMLDACELRACSVPCYQLLIESELEQKDSMSVVVGGGDSEERPGAG
eukprot:5680191-Pleurochrysis_carterae.AAC.1